MGPAAAADASAAKAKAMFSDSDSGSSGDSGDSGSSGDSSSSDSGASGASPSASASGDSRSRSDRAARGRRSRETKRPKNVVGGDASSDALTINASFARRYEHNMRRAETQRLEEKVKREYIIRPPGSGGSDDSDGSDDSSSSSESDEGDVPEKLRKQFAEALVKIKNKDPSLYRPDARLFDEDDEDDEDDEEAKKKSKKKKPKKQTLREVTAAQLLEGGATAFEEEEERRPNERSRGPKNPADAKSYVEEQADLKRAFLDAQKSDSDDDSSSGSGSDSDAGGLRVKRRAEMPAEEDDDARKKALGEYFGDAPIGANEEGSAPREDDGGGIRGGDEKSPATTRLSKEDAFLRDYLMNEKWREAEADGGAGSDDDSDAFEEAERFEQTYNFRFEEPDGGAIRSHARSIEGTIRKESTARKDARRAKKERKMSEKERMRAEVRRLKNLKREEIRAKMAQIARVGGLAGADAVAKAQSLTAEFDPDAHDAAMRMMYDDAYYDGALLGEDGEALEAKPEFGDLDEEVRGLLGAQGATSGGGAENGGDDLHLEGDEDADEGGGAAEESEAFRRVRNALQKKGDDFDGDDVDDSDSDGDGISPEGGSGTDARAGTDAPDGNNKFSKRAAKRWKKELLAKMDEYYRLDAEDFIDDVPCRFKYKEVAPSMYGLTTREILAMSDKDLTQIVPLKKLAPYRRDADESASAREKARSQRMAREFLKRDAERRREKERRGGRKGKNKRVPDEGDEGGDGGAKGEGEDAAAEALEKAAEARKASYGAKAWGKHNVDENGRAIKKKKENAREGGDAGDAKGGGGGGGDAAGGAAPKPPPAPTPRPGEGKNAKKNLKKRQKRNELERAKAAGML